MAKERMIKIDDEKLWEMDPGTAYLHYLSGRFRGASERDQAILTEKLQELISQRFNAPGHSESRQKIEQSIQRIKEGDLG